VCRGCSRVGMGGLSCRCLGRPSAEDVFVEHAACGFFDVVLDDGGAVGAAVADDAEGLEFVGAGPEFDAAFVGVYEVAEGGVFDERRGARSFHGASYAARWRGARGCHG